MPRMLKLNSSLDKSSTFLIETEPSSDIKSIVTSADSKSNFDEMFSSIKPFCNAIVSVLKESTADSANVEFGLKVTPEGELFISKHDDAIIKISLNWTWKKG